jgi:hypothetical protein
MAEDRRAIPRHKTALQRCDLSRPAKCALRDGLIGDATTVFDYGCGRGRDVELLQAQGVACAGWGPAFFPDRPVHEADVVQLGSVLNVIEDMRERVASTATRLARSGSRTWAAARASPPCTWPPATPAAGQSSTTTPPGSSPWAGSGPAT